MSYVDIEVEDIGAVRRIWHNRPAMRNAESQNLLDELDDALVQAGDDHAVRVVILGGRGEHFSAGHDLKESREKRNNLTVEERYRYEQKRYLDYCLRLRDVPKPVIAQVQGACIGGAFMVANMCDLIVASDDAYFADPVVHSVGASAVEVLIHPWVLGERKAKEFLYTGEKIGAEEALRWGMVNRVVPRAELEAATLTLAERIAQAPLFALTITKRSINRSVDIMGQRNAILAHFDTHELSHFTEAFKSTRPASREEAVAKGRTAVA
ncbi:MAG: enoyl-CoA hydratase [Caulobacteraceae bacterium]|nr:enoyl-CoA hydratase [Caulobacteraceae bacterium]